MTYAPLAAILGHPATIEADDGNDVKQAYSSFGYNGAGSITSISRWVAGSANLTTSSAINGNGTVAPATDVA